MCASLCRMRWRIISGARTLESGVRVIRFKDSGPRTETSTARCRRCRVLQKHGAALPQVLPEAFEEGEHAAYGVHAARSRCHAHANAMTNPISAAIKSL